MKKKFLQLLGIICVLCNALSAKAQGERTHIRSGNEQFKLAFADSVRVDTNALKEAEINYYKALSADMESYEARFNLANTKFKLQKAEDAAELYQELIESKGRTKKQLGELYFNKGNALMLGQKIDDAIEAYKNSLRNFPKDLEAKYNLEVAKKLKKEQEQNQKNQDQNKDKNKDNKDQKDKNKDNKDQNKDKNKDKDKGKDKKDKDKDNKDKDKGKDKDKNKDKGKNKDKDKQKQPKKKQGMSPQDAARLLKAIEKDEKKTQEKAQKAILQQQGKRQKSDKDW